MRIFPRFVKRKLKTQARRLQKVRRHLSVARVLVALELLLFAVVFVY